jgi:hypothetical protein
MGSGAVIYITRFHNDGFWSSKVNKAGYTHTHTESNAIV